MFNEDNPLPIENGEINGDFTVYINAMAQSTNVESIGCGVIRTNYTTVTPVYKNRSWGKRVNKNFYNLCVYKGNLNITYQIVGNWVPSGGRFLGYDSSIMATNMLQGNLAWSDAECNTHSHNVFIGTTKIPSFLLYSGPTAVIIIKNFGKSSSLFSLILFLRSIKCRAAESICSSPPSLISASA